MEERNKYNEERLAREDKFKQEQARQKAQRKAYNDLVSSVKSDCGKGKDKSGILAVRYKLEYIENGGIVPTGFARPTAVEAYKKGINQYESDEQARNERRKEKGL